MASRIDDEFPPAVSMTAPVLDRRTHGSTLALLVVLSVLAGWTARAWLYPQSPRGLEAVRKDQRVVVQAVNALAQRIEAVDRRSRAFDRFTSQAISVLVKRGDGK